MNNQTSATETQENNKKICSTLEKIHLIIPVISLISVAIGLFIGFATAVHWSILVTSTTDQTGYLFGRLAIPMGIIVLAFLLIYTILPFLLGSLAVTITSFERLKIIPFKRHLMIAVVVVYAYLLSCIIIMLINSYWVILAIETVFLYWGYAYYFAGSGDEDSKHKPVNFSGIKDEILHSIKNFFMLFFFVTIALASDLLGLIILLNYIRSASIEFATNDQELLYVSLFSISYVFTASGVIFAAKGKEIKENLSVIIFMLFIIGFVLILFDIPQNTLISLNHGILPTPKTLQSVIELSSKKVNHKENKSKMMNCKFMHIITHKDYKLFSCGDQKNPLRGKIFYEKMPVNDIDKISNDNKIISKYYCFASGGNGGYLHCISRYSIVPQ